MGQSAGLGGVDGSAVQAAGSTGDWNPAKDGHIGAHTDAGGQCTDATEASIHADGLARILHMCTRSSGLGQVKSGSGEPT